MAHDEDLAHRPGSEEKRTFGGVRFLLNEHTVGARLGAEAGEVARTDPSARPFDPAGESMKGWVPVDPDGLEGACLGDWIDRALALVAERPPK